MTGDTVALEVVSGSIVVYDRGGSQMFCHNLRSLQKLAGAGLERFFKLKKYKIRCINSFIPVTSSNRAGVFYVLKQSKRVQVWHQTVILTFNMFFV